MSGKFILGRIVIFRKAFIFEALYASLVVSKLPLIVCVYDYQTHTSSGKLLRNVSSAGGFSRGVIV